MKKFSFLKLFSILMILPVFLNSCQKEDSIEDTNVSESFDYSHFEFNYYCQAVDLRDFDDRETDTFDIVISTSIENCSLKVSGFGAFAISESTQTSFSDNFDFGLFKR